MGNLCGWLNGLQYHYLVENNNYDDNAIDFTLCNNLHILSIFQFKNLQCA